MEEIKKQKPNGVPHIDEMHKKQLQELAKEHGTPIFVIDHEKIRQNYKEFRENLPTVQTYYAVKANTNPR